MSSALSKADLLQATTLWSDDTVCIYVESTAMYVNLDLLKTCFVQNVLKILYQQY